MRKRGKLAYMREVLRSYPELCSKNGRTKNEQKRVEIVRRVLETVERMPNAMGRMEIIKRVYFDGTHTLQGAALLLPVSERQAQKWNRELMETMEKIMDLP